MFESEEGYGYMGPYVRMAPQDDGPLHVRALAQRASEEGRAGPTGRPVPLQVVHPPGFRRSLAVQIGGGCAIKDPKDLPIELRTPAWEWLVDAVDARSEGNEAAWAADVLFALGFFESVCELRDHSLSGADDQWGPYVDVLAYLAEARIGTTGRTSYEGLEKLRVADSVWAPARLLAAASQIVGAAKAKHRDGERISFLTRATEQIASQVEDAGDAEGLLFASTFWRAAAFRPHIDNDIEETLSWLDHSQTLIDRAAERDGRLATVAALTRYPILETKSRVLRLAGRTSDALAELRSLSALDPLDARVYLKLGDAYADAGRDADAVSCYARASNLGPPLAPLAHLKLARRFDLMGNLERARRHKADAQRLDPSLAPGKQRGAPARPPAVHGPPQVPVPTVTPDLQRAERILDAAAGKRQRLLTQLRPRLLEAVPQEAQHATAAALDELTDLDQPARRGLLCGPAFSVWMGEAIRSLQGHAPAAQALGELPRVVGCCARNGDLPRLRVGRVDPLITRFIERSNGEDRDRGGPGDVELSSDPAHVAVVERLLDILRDTWPVAHEEMASVIQEVVPFTSGNKTAITNASLHGVLFIRVPFENSAVALDRIAHEAAHVLLNLALEVVPCHDGPPGATMPSPFRDGPRPVEGVLHGVYVFVRAAEAVARSLGAVDAPASAVARIRRSMTLVTSGLQLLDQFGNLNELGLGVASEVGDSARELVQQFGIEQF